MARCEDFPCCGHYDEGTYNSWCPDENGRYPSLNLPQCKYCNTYLDPEDYHDCPFEPESDENYCEECGEYIYPREECTCQTQEEELATI